MQNSENNTFKTKTGYCHVLADKIVLSRDGISGNVAKVVTGNNIKRILLIYIAITIGLFYFAFEKYMSGDLFGATLFALMGLFLLFGIVTSLNNSATPIIERNCIVDVKYKSGLSGLTRARFEVFFGDSDNKIRKRLIMLPGSLTGGKLETEKAIRIFNEEKLFPFVKP